MIKTGIAGADTPMAGELIRILVNHPDVDLKAVLAPGRAGQKISSVHHGLTGETDLTFEESIDPSSLDVVFVDAHSDIADRFRIPIVRHDGESLRVIDMSHSPSLEMETRGPIYGLPELNRRRLVNQGVHVVVPRSIADAALVSLAPLASHMLINSPVAIRVQCPADIIVADKIELARREIVHTLSRLQNSFSAPVTIEASPSVSDRALTMSITLDCGVALEELVRLYLEAYEDHSFTFITLRPMPEYEVEGTNKCLIGLSKPTPTTIRLDTVTDCRMRGGAGTAAHVLNLLFGLTERTGLALKTNAFTGTPGPASVTGEDIPTTENKSDVGQ